MKILFLDDCPHRWEKFKKLNPNVDATWAANYDEAVELVGKNNYDIAYLDHDLDFYQPTGLDFVKYLINNNIKIDKLICHSMNPAGRENMTSRLHGNGYSVINMPWAWESELNNALKLF